MSDETTLGRTPPPERRPYRFIRPYWPRSWRYHFAVTMPMHALGVVDSLVGLLTCGFVATNLSMEWGVRGAVKASRRQRTAQAAPSGKGS